MRVLVTGASGLVGSALHKRLCQLGHESLRLVRRPPREPDEIAWDPLADRLPEGVCEALEETDVVIHLSGQSIAGGRWTKQRKQQIYESRVKSTSLLAGAMAGVGKRPRAFLCASAVGFYGDRGEQEVDENCGPGTGFLAQLCCDWEAACRPAQEAGVRVVNMRFGVVLAKTGGMLAQVLPMFRRGLGGRLGSGQQFLSWISLPDLVAAICFIAEKNELSGPVNLVAPHPVRNRDFTRALARAVGKPAFLPVPTIVLKLALGQMAKELLLASTRAVPRRLLESGFTFEHPDIETALSALLGEMS